MFESGAILLYLASAFGGASTPERLGGMASWIVWVNASFWPGVTGANRAVALPKLATPLNELLAKRTWLLGEEFTAADVAVGACLPPRILELLLTCCVFLYLSIRGVPCVQHVVHAHPVGRVPRDCSLRWSHREAARFPQNGGERVNDRCYAWNRLDRGHESAYDGFIYVALATRSLSATCLCSLFCSFFSALRPSPHTLSCVPPSRAFGVPRCSTTRSDSRSTA